MSTEANPAGEALSVLEAVESLVTEAPEEEATPEVDAEETPDVDPVESTEEESTDPEEVEAAEDELETADSEEPQHLGLDEYGDLTIDVKVNGEARKVTLAEAAKGYQMEADYRHKTQALAEERRQVEASTSDLQERIARLQQQNAQLLAETVGEPPSMELLEDDPYEYTVQKAKWDDKQAKLARARQEMNAKSEAELQKQSYAEAMKLSEKAPEFKDPKFTEDLVRTASETYGISPQEIAATTDHRVFLALRDAIAYRKGQKANPKVAKALATPRKVIKPGTSKTTGDVSAAKKAVASKKLDKPGGVSIDEYIDAKFG